MENYLFKKIYLILVRIGSLWHLGHSFPSPLFASKVLLSMCTTKNIRVPFLPSFQPGPMVSPQKEQAAGLSHPLPTPFYRSSNFKDKKKIKVDELIWESLECQTMEIEGNAEEMCNHSSFPWEFEC